MLREIIRAITIALTMAVIGLAVWGCFQNISDYQENKDKIFSQTFEGRLLLENDEWESFKEVLIDNPDISIEQLRDFPPDHDTYLHLIDFKLKVTGDYQFPYGEATSTKMEADLTTTVFVFVVTVIVAFMLIFVLWVIYLHLVGRLSNDDRT